MSTETGPKYTIDYGFYGDKFRHLIPHDQDSPEVRRMSAKAGVILGIPLSSPQPEEFAIHGPMLGDNSPTTPAASLERILRHPENGEKRTEGIIICGFPFIGEILLFPQVGELKILETDPRPFFYMSSVGNKQNPDWPYNYLRNIEEQRDCANIFLIDSSRKVREALNAIGMRFTVAYPSHEMKKEYIKRYTLQSSDWESVKILKASYDDWVTELSKQTGCRHIVFQSGGKHLVYHR